MSCAELGGGFTVSRLLRSSLEGDSPQALRALFRNALSYLRFLGIARPPQSWRLSLVNERGSDLSRHWEGSERAVVINLSEVRRVSLAFGPRSEARITWLDTLCGLTLSSKELELECRRARSELGPLLVAVMLREGEG